MNLCPKCLEAGFERPMESEVVAGDTWYKCRRCGYETTAASAQPVAMSYPKIAGGIMFLTGMLLLVIIASGARPTGGAETLLSLIVSGWTIIGLTLWVWVK